MAGKLAIGAKETESRPIWQDQNVRGLAIVLLGGVGLVGLAYGVMVVLTSPDGWVTKAATQAMTSEQVASYGSGEPQ